MLCCILEVSHDMTMKPSVWTELNGTYPYYILWYGACKNILASGQIAVHRKITMYVQTNKVYSAHAKTILPP